MKAQVYFGNEQSEPFSANHSVKQGCVLADTLFSLRLTAVLNSMDQGHHMVRTLGHKWEVLKFNPWTVRVVILLSIGLEETFLPWLNPWLCTNNKLASVRGYRGTRFIGFFCRFQQQICVVRYFECILKLPTDITLFWIAIRYTTWSPAVACWVRYISKMFRIQVRWRNWTTDRVLSSILKRYIRKISALYLNFFLFFCGSTLSHLFHVKGLTRVQLQIH